MLAELYHHPSTAAAAENILAGLHVASARRSESYGPFEGMLVSQLARQALAARYSAERCWSPSQLEQYARCPFRFFLASVLAIEPLDEPRLEVDYLGRGQMLHAVLSRLHRRLNDEAGRPASPADRTEEAFGSAAIALVREEVAKSLGDHPLADGLLELDARRVATWLGGYHAQHAAYETAWRHWGQPLRPAHFEVAFGPVRRGRTADEPTDPLSSDEPFALDCGGETIRFSGRIDRIDVGQIAGQAVFSILDYKSGAVSDRTSLKSVLEGYSLQLPLYALAARQLLAEKSAVPFRAAYWHVSADGYKERDAIKFHLECDGRLTVNPEWTEIEARLRQRIGSLVAGIRHGEFPMHSVDDECTSRCEYSTVCRVNQARQLNKSWQPPGEESK